MNSYIASRFEHYQYLLIESPAVSRFTILKYNVTQHDGRIRVKVNIIDNGLLEFAEYVEVDKNNKIATHTYTFHWQDKQKQLIQRWDNVNHYPKLPYAPHHIHQVDGTTVGNPEIPTLEMVLAEIETYLKP